TPPLLALVEAAQNYFTASLQALQNGAAAALVPINEAALVAMAEAVRRGEAVAEPAVVQASSAPAIDFGALSPHARASAGRTAGAASAPDGSAEPGAANDDGVDLGGHRISTTEFTLFSGEVHAQLGVLRTEHDTLVNHGVITDEMLRAAHSLAGLA